MGISQDSFNNLNALSCLPPGTLFHRSRDGLFIPTGGGAANMIGAQWFANLYKGRDPAETASQISRFVQTLIAEIEESTSTALSSRNQLLQKKTFRALVFACQKIHSAIEGRIHGGGLQGALEAYKTYGDAKSQMEQAVQNMKEKACKAIKALRDILSQKKAWDDDALDQMIKYDYFPERKPICPEDEYAEQEWEKAITLSASRQKEFAGTFQYYVGYSTGLALNQLLSHIHYDWHSKIGNFERADLHLSALPITSGSINSLDYMKEHNIGAVLSMTEVFETQSKGYMTSSITPDVYANHKIKHLQIPTPDYQTIYFQLLQRGVAFVHWCLSNGINALVHCKAGKGRSFLIVVCYLIRYQNMSADQACRLVQGIRPQSGFSADREEWETIRIFEKHYLKTKKD